MNCSVSLRRSDFSGVSSRFFTSCCVSVLPPTRYGLSPRTLVSDGAGRADGIDAGMIVEAAILDRQHRLPHARSGICASGTLRRFSRAFGNERGEERRLEHHRRQRLASPGCSMRLMVDVAGELGLAAAGPNDDADDVAVGLAAADHQRDRVLADRELARLLDPGPLRVAEIVQPVDELPVGQRLAGVQLERPGEDAREGARPFAVQPGVDDPRQRDVVVGQHPDDDGRAGRPGPPRRTTAIAVAGAAAAGRSGSRLARSRRRTGREAT